MGNFASMTDVEETQQLRHYQRPFLVADRIERHSGVSELELYQGARKLVLTIESGDFDLAWQMLEELRSPNSTYWAQVRERPDTGLLDLVDRLDRLGWLGEAALTGRTQVAQEGSELGHSIHGGAGWMIEAAACFNEPESYAQTLSQFTNLAAACLELPLNGPDSSNAPVPATGSILGEANIARQVLCLLFDRWRRTSPSVLRTVHSVFMLGRRVAQLAARLGQLEEEAVGDGLGRLEQRRARDAAAQAVAVVIDERLGVAQREIDRRCRGCARTRRPSG